MAKNSKLVEDIDELDTYEVEAVRKISRVEKRELLGTQAARLDREMEGRIIEGTDVHGFFLNRHRIPISQYGEGIYNAEVLGIEPLVRVEDDKETLTGVKIHFLVYSPSGTPAAMLAKTYRVDWRAGSQLSRVVSAVLERPLNDMEARGGVYSKDLLFRYCKVHVTPTKQALRHGTGECQILEVLPTEAGEWVELDDGNWIYCKSEDTAEFAA